jgi:hypothetical protein
VRLPRHDLHILTGAYALNAVDGAERDRFEHHLRRCRPCGNEVRGLAETATSLAMAVAMAPPPRLKARVLTAAAVTRQMPPVTDRRRVPGRLLHGATRMPWIPRLATAVAAVSLAVAVALGAVQLSTRHDLDSARAQNQAIAAVLAAPDARIVNQATAAGGTATVVLSRAQQKIIFTTAGLSALPATKVYELWLIGPPRIRPAGLLPPPSAGKTAPVLASGLVAGDKVGVTVEPAGGTSAPTTTPIVLMSLPA